MGESSPSLLSSMWFLLALPALVAGQCQVNLDKVNGKYPPLLLQNSQFIFPTEKVGEERVLNFEEADSLDLFCHGGSDEKQARIFVRRSDKSRSSVLPLAPMAGPTSWKVFRESPSVGRLRALSLSRLASALMRVTSERFGQTTLCEEPALLSGTLIPRGQVSGLTRVPTQGRSRGFSSGLPAQS